MRKVILYLRGDKVFPQWDQMSDSEQNMALVTFGDQCKGRTIQLGGIDLGTIIDFRLHPHAVGLIVEWERHIEQGQIISPSGG